MTCQSCGSPFNFTGTLCLNCHMESQVPFTAAKVDKPAVLPQRSAAASRNEMATDIAGAESQDETVMRWFVLGCLMYRARGEKDAATVKMTRDASAWVDATVARNKRLLAASAELVEALCNAKNMLEYLEAGLAYKGPPSHTAYTSKAGASRSCESIRKKLASALAKHGGAANV